MKTLEMGPTAIVAALNGFQKLSGSVQMSTGTDPSILTEDSGGPSRATGRDYSHHGKVDVVVPFTGAFKTGMKG
jgi:hypothetical protein